MKLILIGLIIHLSLVNATFYFNCNDNPCQHGKCIDLYHQTAYECQCDEGWEGINCDKSSNPSQNINPEIESNNDKNQNEVPVIENNDFNSNDISDKRRNPCGGDCKNGGYCNEVKERCECPLRYTGKFCEITDSIQDADQNTYKNCKLQCQSKTYVGLTCDYKEAGKKKTCRCQKELNSILKEFDFKNKKDLISMDKSICTEILPTFKDCQEDCKTNSDTSKTNTNRTCEYFEENYKTKKCKCNECLKSELKIDSETDDDTTTSKKDDTFFLWKIMKWKMEWYSSGNKYLWIGVCIGPVLVVILSVIFSEIVKYLKNKQNRRNSTAEMDTLNPAQENAATPLDMQQIQTENNESV